MRSAFDHDAGNAVMRHEGRAQASARRWVAREPGAKLTPQIGDEEPAVGLEGNLQLADESGKVGLVLIRTALTVHLRYKPRLRNDLCFSPYLND